MASTDSQLRLADWFRQWRVPLRRFLLGRGSISASELDDVSQEAFLRLLRYGRTELIEDPQAYLYKVASNVAAEWAIRGRRMRTRDPTWLTELAQTDQLRNEAGQLELQQEVGRALLTLSAQQRQVMKLQFYAGLTRSEIASKMCLSERSVKRALMKGYAKLRQQLSADLLLRMGDGRD